MSFMTNSGARADVYTRITAEIITAIEEGAGDWRAPWFHDGTSAACPWVRLARRVIAARLLRAWPCRVALELYDGGRMRT